MTDPSTPLTGCACVKRLDPLLLRAVDVAVLLNVSKRTLFSMISSGRAPRPDVSLGVGRRLRFWRRATIESWVRAGAPPAATWDAQQGRGAR